MICPLFKSFLFFFFVLLPLPFLAPAPVSAKAPFQSSSAVTAMRQVVVFSNFQAVISGLLLNKERPEDASSTCATVAMKAVNHSLHMSRGHIWKTRGDNPTFKEYAFTNDGHDTALKKWKNV